MKAISSEEVAAYRPKCARYAQRFNGRGGAEFEDLEQEGMIVVWELLRRDLPVTDMSIINRMRDWVRRCRRWHGS